MQNDSNSAAPRAIKVVAMGGGTGLSTLLHGLKQYVTAAGEAPPPGMLPRIDDLSAIVTVSDDGGSSGRLRKELNVPAPGDVRNCIVALSEDEALLSRLFQYLSLIHISEPTRRTPISYAVFCLKKKKKTLP